MAVEDNTKNFEALQLAEKMMKRGGDFKSVKKIELDGAILRAGDKIAKGIFIKSIRVGEKDKTKLEFSIRDTQNKAGTEIKLVEHEVEGENVRTKWKQDNGQTFELYLPQVKKTPVKKTTPTTPTNSATGKPKTEKVFNFVAEEKGAIKAIKELKEKDKFSIQEIDRNEKPPKMKLVDYEVIEIFQKGGKEKKQLLKCKSLLNGKEKTYDAEDLKKLWDRDSLRFYRDEKNIENVEFSQKLKEIDPGREKERGAKNKDTKNLESKKKIETIEEKIIKLLRENKIVEIVIAGTPDADAMTALKLLEDYNNKKIYSQFAPRNLIIPKGGTIDDLKKIGKFNFGEIDVREIQRKLIRGKNLGKVEEEKKLKELEEDKKGLWIFIDAGGEWMKVIQNGETTIIYFDHHGSGKREPTSGTKMTYEMMLKAGILKENPEWLKKYVAFVNDFDNLSFVNKKETRFSKKYLINLWPNSLYALASQKNIPADQFMELCKSEIIKDPSRSFTKEELAGELGSQKIKRLTRNKKSKEKYEEITIRDLCRELHLKVRRELEPNPKHPDSGIYRAIEYAEKNKLDTNSKELGNFIFNDHFKLDKKTGQGKNYNVIPNDIAFLLTKAVEHNGKRFDAYVDWNQKNETFYINASNNENLIKIVERLEKADPGCVKGGADIRATFVFGKIKNLTEEQFLNIIDPKILEIKKEGDPKTPDTEIETEARIIELKKIIGELTPEVEKAKVEREIVVKELEDLDRQEEELKLRQKFNKFLGTSSEFFEAFETRDKSKIEAKKKELWEKFLSENSKSRILPESMLK